MYTLDTLYYSCYNVGMNTEKTHTEFLAYVLSRINGGMAQVYGKVADGDLHYFWVHMQPFGRGVALNEWFVWLEAKRTPDVVNLVSAPNPAKTLGWGELPF